MSEELGEVLGEQVERVLADMVDVGVLRDIEAGAWPARLWGALEELGLPLALVPEAAGGVGLGFEAAAPALMALGRHGAPAPLGETMFAAALLAAAGIEIPAGAISLASQGKQVAWGRHAGHVLTVLDARIAFYPAASVTWQHDRNIAREPRDVMSATGGAVAKGRLPEAWGEEAARLCIALLRGLHIAGALQAALALAVEYANTRKQFGKPIGRFQAIQQQLAVFAEEAAAAATAAASAARAVDRHGLAGAEFEIGCAKIVAGEAATQCASIAHQVFGAIGITEEHSLHHLTRRLWSWRDEGGGERFWAARIGRHALARGGAALWPDLTARDEEAP